ncbi:MAG TPA: lysophospholipid acyltransferase family protein [Cyclobacteriaceae bacterium]|nr:1-acyl-sn-glycerol-3-phosphate acyltransferase [Cyclobacteriaceae bacterium]HMV09125.1 lysophospholipid acyltransferase family protein [Cyclobacteriaceae bacterium]HMV89628.1 lysophospholipid acyltransferase family protein [Cyclobacteriaceae bacterium]HMW99470.1 lysophospholipid acyltransferase family protein [Cyclobacteriaceae bacterium]HMX48741.1 lysophospholipid acyltransferase family protein [Cyclobacteriaceae bacterium]
MKILQALHTAYGFFVFVILFFIFFPLLLIPIVFKKQHHLVGTFNRWWAMALLTLIGMPWHREVRGKPDRNKQYIFCPNHFSYLDIVAMGLNPMDAIFVGKNEMEKIPLFGFMYRKLHITVDRSKLTSKYSSYTRSLEALEQGKSLVIFPEGGIVSTDPPYMSRFKDGAFRLAIEKQIAIVPVTLPDNWIILPDNSMLLRARRIRLIFHEPIEPAGYTVKDIDALKTQVFNVVEQELKKLNA